MNRAAPAAAFKEGMDSKRLRPVERNLFTGEPESIHFDIDQAIPTGSRGLLPMCRHMLTRRPTANT